VQQGLFALQFSRALGGRVIATTSTAEKAERLGGIVRRTAEQIVAGKQEPRERARAIYDWVVDNTFRDPATRGCGLGNIANMLETGYLGGKCADISSLMVGLCRAVGIPAREIYGVRVAGPQKAANQAQGGKARCGPMGYRPHDRRGVFRGSARLPPIG
jgi:transglutaminase-like putative cysteine protease